MARKVTFSEEENGGIREKLLEAEETKARSWSMWEPRMKGMSSLMSGEASEPFSSNSKTEPWDQNDASRKIARKVKRAAVRFGAGSKKMRLMDEPKRNWFLAQLIITVVLLGVMEVETRACAFHTSAVGIYSIDGQPYQFSYSLNIALAVFVVKLLLGPLHQLHKKRSRAQKVEAGLPKVPKPARQVSPPAMSAMTTTKTIAVMTSGKTLKERLMPWILVFSFTCMDMLSGALANYALNVTPTSLYVVFKSSKVVFVAVASRFVFGSNLRCIQWLALLLLCVALLIATFAESKSSTKAGSHLSLQGPILLVGSELAHATMLIMQQIAVQKYWPDPMLLVSASSALGIPVTLLSMFAVSSVTTTSPPYHPVSDSADVFAMCRNSPTLGVALFAHLVFHIAMDISHIVSLKHMSSLSRSLCDIVKLGVMWVIGKAFWFSGEFVYGASWASESGVWKLLSEPWQLNSWMMIPDLCLIGYAMLVFRYKVLVPIRIVKGTAGNWTLDLVKEGKTAEEKKNPFVVDTGLDDSFYGPAFHRKRVRKFIKDKMADMIG